MLFETGFLGVVLTVLERYVDQAGRELTGTPASPPDAGIKGVHHQEWCVQTTVWSPSVLRAFILTHHELSGSSISEVVGIESMISPTPGRCLH